jgi:hypothetical protein
MVILSKQLKKKRGSGVVMIGTYVPKRAASLLSLYCLAHGRTKTSIVKNLINEWVDSNVKDNEDELLELIAQRAFESWSSKVEKRKNWKNFISDLEKELEKNYLEGHSETIIKLIHGKKNESEG